MLWIFPISRPIGPYIHIKTNYLSSKAYMRIHVPKKHLTTKLCQLMTCSRSNTKTRNQEKCSFIIVQVIAQMVKLTPAAEFRL